MFDVKVFDPIHPTCLIKRGWMPKQDIYMDISGTFFPPKQACSLCRSI